MALICMVSYNRPELAEATIKCLLKVKGNHRIVVVDNGSDPQTLDMLKRYEYLFNATIYNTENLGTAKAINMGFASRHPNEYCIKVDSDMNILDDTWANQMEDAMLREPTIGVLGLKRVDLDEHPDNPHPFYKSKIKMLPHIKGQQHLAIEICNHVMGSVCMINPKLLDKIVGLSQPMVYGFDDSILSLKSKLLGYQNAFLFHILIEHLDKGSDEHTQWKQQIAGEGMAAFNLLCEEYKSGKRPLDQ